MSACTISPGTTALRTRPPVTIPQFARPLDTMFTPHLRPPSQPTLRSPQRAMTVTPLVRE